MWIESDFPHKVQLTPYNLSSDTYGSFCQTMSHAESVAATSKELNRLLDDGRKSGYTPEFLESALAELAKM